MAQMPAPGTPGPEPFDARGHTQQPAPGHNAAAPFGQTQLSTTGKLALGALLGGAVWYLYNYGWPFGAKPRTNGRKEIR